MKKKITSWFFGALKWLVSEVIDLFENLTRDLKSLRSLFNWIYLCLYVWLVWYGATRYKESIPTAITATAAIVSAIFAGYVWSKSKDKELEKKSETPPKTTKVNAEEDGASD